MMKKKSQNRGSGDQWLMDIVENPIARRKTAIDHISRLLKEGKSLRVALLLYATDDILAEWELCREDLEEEGRTKKMPSPDTFMKKIVTEKNRVQSSRLTTKRGREKD